MVISFSGALNAFLGIWEYLPGPFRSFILLSLVLIGSVSLLKVMVHL